jgi:hypothetical protein
LIDNKKLEVNDERYLMVPLQVQAKKVVLNLSIAIPLKSV